MSEIESQYLQAARRRSRFLAQNQAKKANREYDQLVEIKQALRLSADRGASVLKRIAEDADPEVRLTAAAFLLAIDEPFALGVLSRIQDSALGLSSFTAEMTICEWKKGNLWEYLS